MPIKPSSLYTNFYSSDKFSLMLKHAKNKTKIIMYFKTDILNTERLPQTVNFLKAELPSIFGSICYNEFKFNFSREVLKTEVGHLFEHILIEYFCLFKISSGVEVAECSGITKWNWHKYPKGSFHITITAGNTDKAFFSSAINKSIQLMHLILGSGIKAYPTINYFDEELNNKLFPNVTTA